MGHEIWLPFRVLFLAALPSALLPGAAGFTPSLDSDFTFTLPAGQKECFYQPMPLKASLEIEYQVSAGVRASLLPGAPRHGAVASHPPQKLGAGRPGGEEAGAAGEAGPLRAGAGGEAATGPGPRCGAGVRGLAGRRSLPSARVGMRPALLRSAVLITWLRSTIHTTFFKPTPCPVRRISQSSADTRSPPSLGEMLTLSLTTAFTQSDILDPLCHGAMMGIFFSSFKKMPYFARALLSSSLGCAGD